MSFWTDPKISDDFTPEDKYFYLYLLTNPHTNISGCYEISIRQMSIETGYSKDSIEKLLDRMEHVHQVICYANDSKELLILHWSKYNWSLSPKVKKSIEDKMHSIKKPEFKAFIEDCYKHIDTLSIGYGYTTNIPFSLGMFSLGINNTNNIINDMCNEDDKKQKKAEHEKDIESFFESVWKLYIRKRGKNQVTKTAKEELFAIGYDRVKECIDKYAREKQGCEEKYILMGSTFFNGRYKDYLNEDIPEVVEVNKNEHLQLRNPDSEEDALAHPISEGWMINDDGYWINERLGIV